MDLSLYLVTDPHIGQGDIVETVTQAVAGGVSVVQIRDKEASDAEIEALTLEIMRKVDVPVFVNDRLKVALNIGCHLHIGQNDIAFDIARQHLAPEQKIGLSIGSHQELDAVLHSPGPKPDLLGIGPVFSTSTKKDAPAGIGLEMLNELALKAGAIPSVAIGGIHPHNARAVSHTAVNGICVVSAIMAAENPQGAAETLLNTFKEE